MMDQPLDMADEREKRAGAPNSSRRDVERELLAELIGGAIDAAPRDVPEELADLTTAAQRAVWRLAGDAPGADLCHPSVRKALHDIVVSEALAERLVRRLGRAPDSDDVGRVVAQTIEYLLVLAATKHEGKAVTHGVVIATDPCGLIPISPPVDYPGHLALRTRTPLLFDGSHAVLVISPAGTVLRGVGRSTLPNASIPPAGLDVFDELTGLDGALTAAASATFRGVGAYVGADQSIWIFDSGTPLFVRRTTQWKPVAIESFGRSVAELGATTRDVAERVARAALHCSLHGSGALLAIAPHRDSLRGQVPAKDHYPELWSSNTSEVDDLHRLITPADLASHGALARLARLDGATIVDTEGAVLAYGAIVRSSDSRGEGARTAAARALSAHVNVAIAVSQDGPITVFHEGEAVLRLL